MNDRVFTGDTLLIKGTGRTDFQNGNSYEQYHSIFDRLLKLPMENLISQLNSVEKVSKNEKFQSVKIIDLRFKNKIIITNE